MTVLSLNPWHCPSGMASLPGLLTYLLISRFSVSPTTQAPPTTPAPALAARNPRGSSREKGHSYNTIWGFEPFEQDMEKGYRQVLYHPNIDIDVAIKHYRCCRLGPSSDHKPGWSIILSILRCLKTVYGSVAVIHLDSHLATWVPYERYTGIASEQSVITHGTLFWHAQTLDVVGTTNPVYLSIYIDVLDPSIAPAAGTPESGGWTTRESKRYIKGLEELNLVGADVVGVSPPYDSTAKTTFVAASGLFVDILAAMVKNK
ncbi:hypothetical protein BDW72DRAFT_197294 [Aspergillus terricola var. indicus]